MLPSPTPPSRLAAALLCLGALATGCPETLQVSCPANTIVVTGLQLDFASVDAGDNCIVTSLPDGGPTDAGVNNSFGPLQGTLCSSAADGGLVYLAILGQKTRISPLDTDGGFLFPTSAPQVTSSQCSCVIDINENFSGTLQSKSGGPAQLSADGGLSPVGSMTASVVDTVTYSDAGPPPLADGGLPSDAGCTCNLPCALRYSVTGKPL